MLLTNDGNLSYSLTHPSKQIKKTYQAQLDKPLSPEDLQELMSGVMVDDEKCFFDSIHILEGSLLKKVEVVLHSGKYHIVKRMFESINYKVRYLDRISFAGIGKSKLKRGDWRYLTPYEIEKLKTR